MICLYNNDIKLDRYKISKVSFNPANKIVKIQIIITFESKVLVNWIRSKIC